MTLGLDYAGGRPAATAIKTAGYDFVVRYLSSGGPGLPGKLLLPEEADALRAADVDIVSNWETFAARMLDGYAAGVYDATVALAQVLACGGRSDRPIYFSADFDATEAQQEPINDYLRGAASVLGDANVGVYGGYWVCARALDAGVARWAWQTDAWSGGQIDPRINLHQRIAQVNVDGVMCDVNEAMTSDYGQWSLTPETQKGTDMADIEILLGDIREQLAGQGSREPGQYTGWPQLGQNPDGSHRTLVDAVAAALEGIAELRKAIDPLAAQHRDAAGK
ncbi:DUF1906 domain-containing protein [Nocardia pseudovaccinii]|uniref:DUF1906 domain-containing protein n=1 Tax=Nocardia pseudovaccinii TaxID=189540 RepID=UPI0007A471F1|nr:DUF1906 domain-containing protein [Nocardia pseudovaccinii]